MAAECFQRLAGHAFDLGRRLLPAVGHRAGLVLVGRLPGLVQFGKRHVLHRDAHQGLSRSGIRALERQDLRLLHLPQTVFRRERLHRVRRAGQIACGRRAGRTHAAVAATKSAGSAATLDQFEALHRLRQIFDPRGSHEADVRRLAQEPGRVDKEPAAAGILEVGVQNGLVRLGDRLHHAVPAIHLVDQVSVDRGRTVVVQDLLSLFRAVGHRGQELEPRTALRQLGVDPLHDRIEVEADVRPIRAGLLRRMQRVDDADPSLPTVLRARAAGRAVSSPAAPAQAAQPAARNLRRSIPQQAHPESTSSRLMNKSSVQYLARTTNANFQACIWYQVPESSAYYRIIKSAVLANPRQVRIRPAIGMTSVGHVLIAMLLASVGHRYTCKLQWNCRCESIVVEL